MDMTREETQKIMKAYKRKREQEKARYDRLKKDPEFIENNRARARSYYVANKDKKAEIYKENKAMRSAKSLHHYYASVGREDVFIERYPEKYILITSAALGIPPAVNPEEDDSAGVVPVLPES